MLIGTVAGEHVGNCSLLSLENYERYAHRCSVAIALYQKYCGLGIGREMLKTVLAVAKQCGYEQAELEVVSTNTPAIDCTRASGLRSGERSRTVSGIGTAAMRTITLW